MGEKAPEIEPYDSHNSSIYIGCNNFQYSTYSLDQDPFQAWPQIERLLTASLPLKNLMVKTKSGVIKLEKVETTFAFDTHPRFQYPNIPLNWYTKPFVSLFLIRECEVNRL